jgi:hypothetical protein
MTSFVIYSYEIGERYKRVQRDQSLRVGKN